MALRHVPPPSTIVLVKAKRVNRRMPEFGAVMPHDK
jgi:hypothetical protein